MKEYLQFWGIARPAFRGIDPEGELYWPERAESLKRRLLVFCHQDASIVAITAPSGHGKTTLGRWLYHQLPPATHDVLFLSLHKTESSSGWLYPRLTRFLGVGPQPEEIGRGLDEITKEGRRLAVIIDEAHKLVSRESWDEIATLIGLQSATGPRLSFVLLGNPELENKLFDDETLRCRLAFRAHFPPLTSAECKAYLKFRLNSAGMSDTTFTSDACEYLYEFSGGLFGSIDALAEASLVEGYFAGKKLIDQQTVAEAHRFLSKQDMTPTGTMSERQTEVTVETAIDGEASAAGPAESQQSERTTAEPAVPDANEPTDDPWPGFAPFAAEPVTDGMNSEIDGAMGLTGADQEAQTTEHNAHETTPLEATPAASAEADEEAGAAPADETKSDKKAIRLTSLFLKNGA